MKPSNQTLGRTATMPTILHEVKLPKYVTERRRRRLNGSERLEYWFEVPKRLRPKGWLAAQRLPLEQSNRTGVGDLAELTAVVEDGKVLYRKLLSDRARDAGQPTDFETLSALQTRGTLPWLITKLKEPPGPDNAASKWHRLGKDSQRNYEYAFREIIAWSSTRKQIHPPASMIFVSHIVKFLSKFAAKPFKQRAIKVALQALFEVARLDDQIKENPMRHLPLAMLPTSEPIEWPADVVDTLCELAISRDRKSIALFLRIKWWTGWRTRDIVRLKEPNDFKDGVFRFRTGKRGKWVGAEATPDVLKLIARTRPEGAHVGRAIVTNEATGQAYNERTLSKHIKKMLADVGRPDLEPGWLRHTVMTELEELEVAGGASAALVGHSPASHAAMKDRHYRINNPRLAKIATDRLMAHRRKQ